ncbi:5,6-dimethylbenzimidazole synthase [Natrarchaeobaculum sulfurireducens]|uniref:Cobalamin biosynthesis protein BluB / 5,6-dimethylbenzimidazole synthase, flavin destructase family n=1 Tax=Natrarchaeobaculum sulfurireducens TaxID=2044521 RepID=A0A346PRG6_9EURY|nr:5,6-dimethylbenzimidazole synthase [Natrarchaeobaculum sulfurireducens]AXR77906.1 Nitroreductase [Natrarchaeobaculum sulfurireducens]AXR82111.1 Cobalamin biosynthesis protein BluB / 5,6-dimethylbenzimidazole synthase, flavin destructase family [Natrarchaeobaculum sulfurireducens]
MVTFTDDELAGVYKAIYARRDIRRFAEDPVPDAVLERILEAAHHAPSVGFSQPWDLVVVTDDETKTEIAEIADRAIAAAREGYEEPRRSEFAALKLEGIRESPVNICVTCDPTRGAPHVLGRSSMKRTDVYSTCLAIQNLWLAARAEGIGVGWVSVLYPYEVQQVLDIPPHVKPIAYLCVGYPEDGFPEEPVLQQEGWRERIDVDDLLHEERWEGTDR